tara:strand:- start:2203 stop:2391 length:189 start_codon:yes stop_codon:yes gene_type:complete
MLVQDIAGLYIPPHDYISITPTAAPSTGTQTITYKEGGASGTTVATLTITYAGGNVSTVVRS